MPPMAVIRLAERCSTAEADAIAAGTGGVSGPTGTKKNDLMVAANLIFKF